MSDERARAAAEAIWASWERGQRLEQLPESCRPHSLEAGYAVQAVLEPVSLTINGRELTCGHGADVPGGPLVALALILGD